MRTKSNELNSEFNIMTPLITIDTNYKHFSLDNQFNYDKKQSYTINNFVSGEVLDNLMNKRNYNDRKITNIGV